MLTYTSDFTPGPGGVMTAEVGVITGDLTLRTEVTAGGSLTLRVQYTGAEEWYAVAGGQAALPADVLTRGGAVPPDSAGWTPYA